MTDATRDSVHDLKTWPGPFAAVREGLKTWEFRLDDRDYREGDTLRLHEWWPDTESYTGRVEVRRITWLLRGGSFGIPEGYVVMSIEPDTRRARLQPGDGMVLVHHDLLNDIWNGREGAVDALRPILSAALKDAACQAPEVAA